MVTPKMNGPMSWPWQRFQDKFFSVVVIPAQAGIHGKYLINRIDSGFRRNDIMEEWPLNDGGA